MTNPMYKSVNGLLLSKDGQTLISGINGNVTIPDGITSIGSYASSNCSGLTSVTIPDSVTSIGSYAFSGCSGLTSVTIPDSVTSIGYDAFEDCSGLTSVTIGNSVTNIGSFAFYGCSGLTDVTIPDGVTNIGYSAFYDTPFYNNKPDGLVIFGTIVYKMKGSFPTTVTIPNGVTSIGMYAFSSSGCSVMTSVIIPDSVMRIEECAFEGCRGLTNVTIGTGVMSIGLRAFFHCSGLTSVTIPDSVTSIGSWAFSGCSGLASVTIPSNVDNIYAYAFDGCENLNSIFVPRGCSVDVRAIPSATTVYRYTPIQTILFDRAGGVAEIDSITVKWGEPYGVLPIPNRTGYSFNGWKCGDMVVTQDTIVTVLDDHTLVAQWTPNKYTVIFSANGGTGGMIGSLDYGSALVAPTVTRTGYTFKGWSPNVPATVPLGGATYTALWTPNKYIVTFNANGGTGGTSREMDYESALVAPTVTRTDYTFKGWSPSVPATVPLGGATYTAQWQLNQYTVTFDANGGEGGTSRVFAHGASLTLPTVTRRSHEFVGWFTAADGGTQIAEGAVVVGDMVLYAHWEQQPTVLLYEVSDGKATITKYSSPACEIVVPLEIDGYPVVGIGAGAFANCTELTSVTIPNSVTNIGAAAFSGCSGLTEITLPFVGSQRGTSGSPDSLFGYIFGTSSYTGGTGVRQYVTSSLLASYYIPSSLRCVTLTDETLLGYGAFSSCSGLTNVVINGSMNSIGERAFLNCIGLVSVKIPDTVTDIGTNAFRHCTELVSISMGNRVERIHNAAFQECRNLVNVTLPDSVQSLGPTAFSYCSSLTDMVLSNVTNIAFNAFYECTELKRVEFHACLNAIGSAVFYNCTNLTALTFYDDAPKIVRGNLFNGTAPDGSCAYVRRNSTGWNVPIPGTWNGIAIDYIHHTVTLDSNGGTCATGELSIADGDMVGSLPIPRKEGHGFLGWFTAANGGDKLDETMVVDEDVILYAHWGSLTIEEALGVGEGVTVTTDENFPWLPIFDLSAKLGDAMARSGGIGNRTNTWLSATVEGAGTMAFWCKTSCEHDEDDTFTWDRLMVYTNDVEIVDWRMDGETGWTERTLSFDGGVNTVKWVYYKDKNGTEGEDCAWVDGVTWTPSGSADVVVPVNGTNVTVSGTWLAEKTARAATDDAANGRKVWQCYMLGLDPEQADDDFRITRFWMDGDKPMFEFSHTADGSGNTFVPRIRKMGSATPTGPWQEVPATGNPAYRFFKAEVALP